MGLFKAMAAVAEAEGVLGLYRGLGTASVRLVPMAIVSFASYEWVRRTMDAADARARTKEGRDRSGRGVNDHDGSGAAGGTTTRIITLPMMSLDERECVRATTTTLALLIRPRRASIPP